MPPNISVVQGNVLDFKCDVLALKYAQGWHGADAAVAKRLALSFSFDGPAQGDYRLVSANGKLSAAHVLFQGTCPLNKLSYAAIRELSRLSMLHVCEQAPNARHVALTIHGVNVGLDEREAFLSQLAGIVSTFKPGESVCNSAIEQITIVEHNAGRARRLADLLELNYTPPQVGKSAPAISARVETAGESDEKPHIFVAMPFMENMEDVYIFGIQAPVQNSGFLCERIDMAVFSGDILDRIKHRIQTAYMIIADLSCANANVYLEVGYAWGIGKRAILLCRNVDELKFDVKGQRCLIYSSINDLNKKLQAELDAIGKAKKNG